MALSAGAPGPTMRRKPEPWAWIQQERVTQPDVDPATAQMGSVMALMWGRGEGTLLG